MPNYFHRQLGYYADAHRDRVNSIMHMIGNPILFVAVVLPLSLLPVSVLGVKISAAPLLTIPALVLWTAWDIAIGLAIVVTSIPLLLTASAIAGRVSLLWVWVIAVGLFVLGWALQIVGHQLFEGKRPTLLDNPVQMLISPMYIFAKLFVALGLRPDLAAVFEKSSQQTFESRSFAYVRLASDRSMRSVKRRLVTGGSGFIGQHLVAALLAQGCRVRVLDLRPPSYAGAGVQYVKGSILDAESVHEALDDVAEGYHLAALPGMWARCKNDFHAVNYRGTEIVLEAARRRGVSRFLHCSTESILFGASPLQSFPIDHVGTALDEMPGVYTRSKLAAEQRALQAAASGFPVVIVNPTMPIGPHYGNLTPPTLMLRYFIHRRIQLYFDFVLNLVDVRDVAAGLLLAMKRGQSGQRYILGGEAISLGKVLIAVGAITGRKALRVPIPAGVARTTAAVMEFVSDHVTHRPPAGTVEGVRIALRSQSLSIEKSRRELGYAPNPIGPALRETVASLVGRPGKFDKLVGSHGRRNLRSNSA